MPTPEQEALGFAFGLRLRASFDAPGIAPAAEDLGRGRASFLKLVSERSLEEAFADSRLETLADDSLAGARFAVCSHPEQGILVHHDYFGRFRVAADGTLVDCAPRAMAAWMWQRLVVGQLLPIASALQGLEPMHASAVAVDGQAILLLGTSGAGKTSVALQTVQAGGAFVADDVAAIELADGRAYVHPGPALSNVDAAELNRLDSDLTRSWRRLGRVDGEERVQIADVQAAPLPISHVFVLTREQEPAGISIESERVAWAAALLGANFNPYIGGAARSARWLEVCGSLADSAGLHHVVAPMAGPASAVAHAVLARIGGEER